MGNILAICEYADAALRSSALSNLAFARAAAQAHGGEVIIALLGSDANTASGHAAKFAGQVVVVEAATLEHYMAESYAPIIARLAKEHGVAVVCATATSMLVCS